MLIHSFQALMCTFIPYFKKSNSVYQISAGIHPIIHARWQTHTKQLSLLIWWVFSSWVGVIGLGDSTSDSVLWCGRARRRERERERSRENIYRTHTQLLPVNGLKCFTVAGHPIQITHSKCCKGRSHENCQEFLGLTSLGHLKVKVKAWWWCLFLWPIRNVLFSIYTYIVLAMF